MPSVGIMGPLVATLVQVNRLIIGEAVRPRAPNSDNYVPSSEKKGVFEFLEPPPFRDPNAPYRAWRSILLSVHLHLRLTHLYTSCVSASCTQQAVHL